MKLLSGLIAGLLALGLVIWVILLPSPRGPTAAARAAAEAGAPQVAAAPAPGREVRVVYPDVTTAGTMRADAKASEPRTDVAPAPQKSAEPSGLPVPAAAIAVATVQPASSQAAPVPTASIDTPVPAGATVNLNTASVEALNQLPGGGAIGRTIVAHRPYRSIDDLINKRVLRRSVFERIKQQVAAE